MQLLESLDTFLNRITVYRLMVYGLRVICAASLILALAGTLPISAWGLCISAAVIIPICYGTNRLLAHLLRVPTNSESWNITALILICILPGATSLQRIAGVAAAALMAIALKYLLTWRGSNLLNPAASGAFIVSLAGIIPVTWWIGSPALAPITAVVGFLILRKTRRFALFGVFALASILMALLVGCLLNGESAIHVIRTLILSWPLLFLGTIMLTEPSTLPATRYYQLLYAALVGVIFTSQLHFGTLATTPQAALILGNLFALIVAPHVSTVATLVRRRKLAPAIFELAFTSSESLNFMPGQYLEWTLPHPHTDRRGNRRSFSIASSPTEQDVLIAMRQYRPSSSFKTALLNLTPGQQLRATNISGNFIMPPDTTRPMLWIAGGIGITPFRSMAKFLVDTDEHRVVHLFSVADNEHDFIYKDVFGEAARIGLSVTYHTTPLPEVDIQKALMSNPRALVYISGPDAMVRHYTALARRAGAPATDIKTDYFSGY